MKSGPLRPGSHVGPYEITGHLGSGGMGDVYRARDSRVDRDVAIKLPRLSPNGQWLAYESDKLNGRFDVYVDTFTGKASGASAASSGSWRVSTDGGTRPVWSRDGKE